MNREGLALRVLFALTTAVLFAALVWPVATVLVGGFRVEGAWTGEYILAVFRNPIYCEGLLNGFKIALGSALLATFLALPLAVLSHHCEFAGKRALNAAVLLPMILPPFVGAIGVAQMFGPYGAFNALFHLGPIDWLGHAGYWGVVALQGLCFYPIIYLNVVAALANVDPALDEAAQNLGAGAFARFFRVTLPLISPGFFAGFTLVFIACFTELGTPLIMNYRRCVAVQVFDALKDVSASPFPSALTTVVLATSAVLYALARLLFGGRAFASQGRAARAFEPRTLKGARGLLAALPFVLVALLAILPHLGVVCVAFSGPGDWYRRILPHAFTVGNFTEALGHPLALRAVRNSVFFAAAAVGVNAALGVAVSWIAVRTRLALRALPDQLSMIPLAVPGLVMAFGYAALSAQLSSSAWARAHVRLAAFLDVRENPVFFLVAAYAVRRLPYMVRAVTAGLQQTSRSLEEAASNLGAGAFTVLRRITLPLVMANVAAGALLVFAFSMLEVSDSLMLAQKAEFYPITKTIYEMFQMVGTGANHAAALGVWAMLFLAVTLVGASVLLGRRLGALFRA